MILGLLYFLTPTIFFRCRGQVYPGKGTPRQLGVKNRKDNLRAKVVITYKHLCLVAICYTYTIIKGKVSRIVYPSFFVTR
jgi:hypothetical protein